MSFYLKLTAMLSLNGSIIAIRLEIEKSRVRKHYSFYYCEYKKSKTSQSTIPLFHHSSSPVHCLYTPVFMYTSVH